MIISKSTIVPPQPVNKIRTPRFDRLSAGRFLPRLRPHSLTGDERIERIERRPPSDLIDEFTDIKRTALEAEQFTRAERFARRFGLLGLCEHGLPHMHAPGCKPVDRVSDYVRFASCLDAVLTIGATIKTGNGAGEASVWRGAEGYLRIYGAAVTCEEEKRIRIKRESNQELSPEEQATENTLRIHNTRQAMRHAAATPVANVEPTRARDGNRNVFRFKQTAKQSSPIARMEFERLIAVLIRVCSLQPGFRWERGNGWRLDFDGMGVSNLPAILVFQLITRLGGTSMRKCAVCPRWFQPRVNGPRKYCKEHGTAEAMRVASREYYKKHKEEILARRRAKQV